MKKFSRVSPALRQLPKGTNNEKILLRIKTHGRKPGLRDFPAKSITLDYPLRTAFLSANSLQEFSTDTSASGVIPDQIGASLRRETTGSLQTDSITYN